MKNKLSFILLSLTALALIFSCQRDEKVSGNGLPEDVVISVAVPYSSIVKSPETPGDGTMVTRCILEIYEDGVLYGEPHYADIDALGTDFTVRLVSGNTYSFVFWADYASGSAAEGFQDVNYNTSDGLTAISVIADEYLNNDDSRDAFYGSFSTTIESGKSYSFTLSRPFGRVQLFTTDLETSGIDLDGATVKVSYAQVPSTFNALNNTLGPERITLAPYESVTVFNAVTDDPTEAQLSYDYILATDNEGETLVNFTLSIEKNGQTLCSGITGDNIPVRQNYRTNVRGGFLAGTDVDITVDINPGLGDDPEDPSTGYTSIADVRALYVDGNVTVSEDWTICGTVISNLDLNNGSSLKNIIIQDGTAGIMIRLASDNTEFLSGDVIEVRIQGQSLEQYMGLLQLNNVPVDNVTEISQGTLPDAKVISAAQLLTGEFESQYVAVENVQVVEADRGKNWIMNNANTSITFESSTGEEFVVYTTRYSSVLADTPVPEGSGTLKGIAQRYNDNIQIMLATTEDYAGLTGERFGSSDEPGPEEPPVNPGLITGTEGNGIYTSTVDLTQPSALSSDTRSYASTFLINGDEFPGIKIGSSGNSGAYSFYLGKTGSATLTMYAVAWNNAKTRALVKISGGGTINGLAEVELDCQTNSGLSGGSNTFTVTFGSSDFYSMNIEGATESTIITVTTEGMSGDRIGFTGVNIN